MRKRRWKGLSDGMECSGREHGGFIAHWKEQLQSENLLEGYRVKKLIGYTNEAHPLTEINTDFMLKTLDHIKVFEDGALLVVFLDGTELEI